MNQQYHSGTGRRKSAVARVRLYPGAGTVIINGKPLEEVFVRPAHQIQVLRPLQVTESEGKFNAQVKVEGGGISGWAGAIAHGIARALVEADENLKKPLRAHGLLTRDPRVKERKKYGLKRARKAPQYTKR
ncbi:MAG: 30S ribosomal protein S9 [Dehalococcoidia bacterium]|nr:30S ribosomal protein S9 [Dehalococcoidia bacterium]